MTQGNNPTAAAARAQWGPGKIDVHHHFIPDFYRKAMDDAGIGNPGGMPLPNFTPVGLIERFDKLGIGAAIMSLSTPGVYFGDAAFAIGLARRCNEYAAELTAAHKSRIGFFGTVPSPLAQASVAEAVHSLDVLKADGICLLASTDGVFVGDARYEELMAELNQRDCVVFIHPHLHPASVDIGVNAPKFLLEFVFDTTRAALNLAMNGVLDRYPRIRWILAHAGGTVPYLQYRVAWMDYRMPQVPDTFRKVREQVPGGIAAALRKFYYDTALSTSPAPMAALRSFVEPSQILFGSDGTYVHDAGIQMEIDALGDARVMPAELEQAVSRENALALFPRFG